MNIPVRESYHTFKEGLRDVGSIFTSRKRPRSQLGSKTLVRNLKNRLSKTHGGLFVTRKSGQVAERKCLESSTASTANQPTTAGIFQLLNGLAEGTGIDQRIGRRVQIKSISVRMWIYSPVTITETVHFRALLVQDRQCNGALPIIADIFALASVPDYSYYNLDNRERFRVITDRKFHIQSEDGIHQSHQMLTMSSKMPVETTYNDTGSGITDIATNSIFLLLIANRSVTNDTNLKIDYIFRTRYYDV